MMRQALRLSLDDIGEVLFQRGGGAGMQFLPPGADRCVARRFLHQCVFEPVGGLRGGAAAGYQASLAQLRESGVQIRLSDDLPDQIMGELVTEHCTDLRDLASLRREAIKTGRHRNLQNRRNVLSRGWGRGQNRGQPILRVGALEHRLGQLLDE